MRTLIQNLLLFFCLPALLITSCQKDDANPPTDPNAVLSLIDSEAACASMLVTGNFVQGKPLQTNENIKLEVVVSKAGGWSFSSDTLNGFSFSGSGNFSDTGKHVISLLGSGTPINTGNYVFSTTIGSVKRSILISVLKGDVVIEAVPLKSYFKATVDGVQYYTEAPTIGPDNIPYGRGGNDTVSFASFVGANISPAPPGSATASLQKGLLNSFSTSTEADFKNFFKPGAYPFSGRTCSNIFLPGIIFGLSFSNSELWTTLRSGADQTGSSFTIVGIEDGHDNKGHYFVKVKSRFNCRLYNLQGNQVKELKDGEMVSFFIK
jgi:hypothetical protein